MILYFDIIISLIHFSILEWYLFLILGSTYYDVTMIILSKGLRLDKLNSNTYITILL